MPKSKLNKSDWERITFQLFKKEALPAVKERLLQEVDINAYEEESGDTFLIEACRRQRHDSVIYFLKKGATVDKVNKEGHTPLWVAAHGNEFSTVKELVDAGANVNHFPEGDTDANYSPLYALSSHQSEGSIKSAKYLLLKGAKPDLKGRLLQIPPLYCAAQFNNQAMLRVLFSAGASPNVVTANNETALHGSWRLLDETLIDLLLANRVDASIEDSKRDTVLISLIAHAKPEQYPKIQSIIKVFYKHSVNLDQVSHGHTAVSVALNKFHLPLLQTLFECKVNADLLFLTRVEFETKVTVENASPSQVCVEELTYTPLGIAASGGYVEGVQFLISKGANVNTQFSNSVTALYVASQWGHEKIVSALLKAGADPRIADNQGSTPLFIAVQQNNIEVIKCLLHDDRTVVDQANSQGYPLHIAALKGHFDAARLLLAYGAKVNVTTSANVTPVFLAAQEGREKVLELLLQNGGDPEIKRTDGNSPLFMAYREGHNSCVRLLLRNFYQQFLQGNNQIVDFKVLLDTFDNLPDGKRGIVLVPTIVDPTPAPRAPQSFFAKKPPAAAASSSLPAPVSYETTAPYSQNAYSFLTERGFTKDDIQKLRESKSQPDAPMAEPVKTPFIDPRDVTWCKGVTHAGLSGIIPVEGTDSKTPNCYLYFDWSNLEAGRYDLSVFDHLVLKFCAGGGKGEQGIKRLKTPISATVKINGEVISVQFEYELKAKASPIRILCFSLPSDRNNGLLLIGALLVDKGLHKAKSEKFLAVNKIIEIQLPLQNTTTDSVTLRK
jgi:ankyrin repeat protein